MTVQEMHVGVKVELQRINAGVNKNFLPEELDWLLNNEVIKFIKQRINKDSGFKGKGFQDDSKRLADLKDLVRTVPIETFKKESGEEYIKFPPDYFHYIRFDANIKKRCREVLKTSTKTFKQFILPIPRDINSSLSNFSISIDNTEIFNLATSLPTNYISSDIFNTEFFSLVKALKIILKKKIKELYNSSNNSLYWEDIGYDYYSNSFIFITDANINTINITSNSNNVNYSSTPYNIEYHLNDFPLNSSIRITDEEFYLLAKNSTLSNSNASSLLGTVKQNCLEITVPSSVVLNKIRMTYFCTPSILDVNLNNDLNMSNSVCREIISNTVRFMKALIEDNNYEAYIKENMLIE